MLNDRQQQSTFPPHNILKARQRSLCRWPAVAAFGKDEIDITVEDNVLIIKGVKKEKDVEGVEYIHKYRHTFIY